MNTISIKVPDAPSMTSTVRVSRALSLRNVRKVCSRALALARRQSVTLAAISGAICYSGALLEQDPLTFAGAFATLAFVRLATPSRKGGEK